MAGRFSTIFRIGLFRWNSFSGHLGLDVLWKTLVTADAIFNDSMARA